MITLHGEEVRVGDRVWSMSRGWGKVIEIASESACFPILVRFGGCYERYTKDGKFYMDDENPTLFWQQIEFEIPKKPKPKEKAWQWVCKTGDRYYLTYSRYASKQEALERLYDSVPIEPYLPSEIERFTEEDTEEGGPR